MRKLLLLFCIILTLGNLNTSARGFTVEGSKLLDGNGNTFLIRGINVPYAWYNTESLDAIPDIAQYGANAVRVVLSNGERWGRVSAEELKEIIELCKSNNLIAVLEIHDCTGYPEQDDSAPISTAVDYWLDPDIQELLHGEENYIIINIANEPYGNNVPAQTWVEGWVNSINRLRDAGFDHNIMVDAANWGQDWENIMKDNARDIINSDPHQNITFSIHMYEVYQEKENVQEYLSYFKDNNLPLLVGEFGPEHFGTEVAIDAIFELTNKYNQGYIGWSWSGNTPEEIECLDMVERSDWSTLTPWGERIIHGDGGIKETSKPATVFE